MTRIARMKEDGFQGLVFRKRRRKIHTTEN